MGDASYFEKDVETNENEGSVQDMPSELMPARAFFFVAVDEVGKDGLLVRKVYSSIDHPYLENMNLSYEQKVREVYPEAHGLSPKDAPNGGTIAEHAMGDNKLRYISTSKLFPEGSPRFDGKTVFIDIGKAKQAGVVQVSTEEIIQALEEYKANVAKGGSQIRRVDKVIGWVRDIDHEVLLDGTTPARALFTPETLPYTRHMVQGARVVQVFGIMFTAYDLAAAGQESIEIKSARPIAAETVRQTGGWGGAAAGMRIGGAAGVLLGVETGPGAILSGLIGGIAGGVAGYFGADWIADNIYEN